MSFEICHFLIVFTVFIQTVLSNIKKYNTIQACKNTLIGVIAQMNGNPIHDDKVFDKKNGNKNELSTQPKQDVFLNAVEWIKRKALNKKTDALASGFQNHN